jgi:hypothetical protein
MRAAALRILAAGVLAASCLAGPAAAGTRMFSYDPISADAKRLTGAGLTVLFQQKLTGTRPIKVLATGVPAQALLSRARDGDLGKGGLAVVPGADVDAALFLVDAKAQQGGIYLKAFCPGATRLWLSFSPIRYGRDLRVQALGADPKTGAARLCGTLDFSFRGEWRLPGGNTPDPMEERDEAPF